MSDLISRQNAIDAWDKLSKRGRTEFDQVLMTLPSAEPKTGRWVWDAEGYFRCSKCGKKPRDQSGTTDYCPNCGAKMVYCEKCKQWVALDASTMTNNRFH